MSSSVANAAAITVDLTGPGLALAAVADAQNGVYDSGFTVTAGATVSVTINGVALADVSTKFSSSTSSGVTTYTALAGAFTGSESVTAVSPGLTDAPSLSHVRLRGAPWVSQRPPHAMIAGS